MNILEMALNHHEIKLLKLFIDELYQCSEEHFHHEEKLQRKFMFSYIDKQQKEHRQLLEQLNVVKNHIYSFLEKVAPTPEEYNTLHKEVNRIMRGWFIDHIVKSDMQMKGLMDQLI